MGTLVTYVVKEVKIMGFLFLLSFFVLVFTYESRGEENTYLIPVPHSCCKVEQVKDHKVYLRCNFSKVCSQAISFKKVKVRPDSEGFVEVYLEGNRLWNRFKVGPKAEDYVIEVYDRLIEAFMANSNGSLEVGKRLGDEVKKAANKVALEISSYAESKEFQKKIDSFKDHLSRVLLGSWYERNVLSKSSQSQKESRHAKEVLTKNERLYVFVSSSVPSDLVRHYVSEASNLGSKNVIFVLRGGINGLTYLRPTVDWILNVMLVKKECDPEKDCFLYPVRFVIDPLLFRKYKVSRVPAFVFVEGVIIEEEGSEGLDGVKFKRAYKTYGDVDFYRHLLVLGQRAGKKEFVKLFCEKRRKEAKLVECENL